MTKYALISVSDKTGIIPMSHFLFSQGYTILSTGGTYRHIYDNLPEGQSPDSLIQVSDFTGFPEILGGRVKTLHPKIYGGLLWDGRFNCNGIDKIDIVVVNLYPFEEKIKDENITEDIAIENIDIGGVSLIRAASKNFKNVRLLVDPADYEYVCNNWDSTNMYFYRKNQAIKGFDMVTRYDAAITNYFSGDIIYRKYTTTSGLKYGCNPYQDNAAIYKINNRSVPFDILNGSPGYINLLDAINSWMLVTELSRTVDRVAASSFKHTSPAGVAISMDLFTNTERLIYDIENMDLSGSPSADAFIRARNCDPLSSFGDFIAISGTADELCARLIGREVSDGIIAQDYTPEALNILKKKKGGKYIVLRGDPEFSYQDCEFRELMGMALSQRSNDAILEETDITNIVTNNTKLSETAKLDMVLSTITLKYTPSNSIAIAHNGSILGVGAGQQNRVDCIKLAGRKADVWRLRRHPRVLAIYSLFKSTLKRPEKINAITQFINGNLTETETEQLQECFTEDVVPLSEAEKTSFLNTADDITLSSDAFMPFRDNVDTAAKFQVRNIIQPGGSNGDASVIEACDQYNMIMSLTGKRFFLH